MKKEKKRTIRFPILAKAMAFITLFSVIIVEIAMTYFSIVSSNRNRDIYNKYANNLSATIADVVDVDDYNLMRNKVVSILDTIPQDEIAISDEADEDKINHYIAYYDVLYEDNEFVETFNRTREFLREIVKSNESLNVDCAYLSFVHIYTDADGVKQGYCVYLVDTAPDEDACPPGWIDSLYAINRDVLDDPTKGFEAYVTDTAEYGYLTSAGSYIKGTDMGFAFVDISMTAVRAVQAQRIVRMFIYLTVTVILIAIAIALLVQFMFIKPLTRITNAAKSFNNQDPKMSHDQFDNLNINTHDELEDLSNSLKEMENGVVERFDELIEINKALSNSEKKRAKMTELANRDALTGVGSKTAYDYQVEKINKMISDNEPLEFSVTMIDLNYLKVINDQFGHAAGDEALIKLASTICLTFTHSPVYRVGGDEFVVLSRNSDYQRIDALVNEFKEKMSRYASDQSVIDVDHISAAIGYALYNKDKDKSFEDVFKRADKRMYECKWIMKQNNG